MYLTMYALGNHERRRFELFVVFRAVCELDEVKVKHLLEG